MAIKTYKTWGAAHGMTLEGVSVSGWINGYLATVMPVANTKLVVCKLYIEGGAQEKVLQINEQFKTRKKEWGRVTVVLQKNVLNVNLDSKLFRRDNFDACLYEIMKVVYQCGVVPASHCSVCSRQTTEAVLYRNAAQLMCESCLRQKTEEDSETHANQTGASVFTGFIGAFIGAIVGILPYFLLAYFTNIYVGYAALLSGLCAFLGYRIFRGSRRSKVALAAVIVASLCAIVTASVFASLFTLYQDVATELYAGNVSMPQMLKDYPLRDMMQLYLFRDTLDLINPPVLAEVCAGLWEDLGFTLLFGMVGVLVSRKSLINYCVPKKPVLLQKQVPAQNSRVPNPV